MQSIKFYSIWGRNTVEIDISRIQTIQLKNGRPSFVAYDPATGGKMFKLASAKEMSIVAGIQADKGYLEQMEKNFIDELQNRRLDKPFIDMTYLWVDYYNNEEFRTTIEEQTIRECDEQKKECNSEADETIDNARRQLEQIKGEYEKAMERLKPYLS
jgi:hypothetical protein